MSGHKRTIWVQTCMGTNVSGHNRVWAQTCRGTNVCGHKRVRAQTCVATNVCGHNRVWAQSCLGTIVSGHNRVWAQSCVGSIVWAQSCIGPIVWSPLLTNKCVAHEPSILLGGEPIARTGNFKYLRIMLGDKLKFNTQIEYVKSRLSQFCGITYRL